MTELSSLKNFLCSKAEYRYGAGAELLNGPTTLRSELFQAEFSLGRQCTLHVPGKFLAQTLVIFPAIGVNTPILGLEYIEMPGRCFGAVDFHPQGGDFSMAYGHLADCPDREIEKSKHYDLDKYFSPKLWLRKSADSLYDEFANVSEDRIQRYHTMLAGISPVPARSPTGYCRYMAEYDPARGILKAYFGRDFADDYISSFLFPENPDYSCMLGYLSGLPA
jgi:hypothetical protein